MILRTCCAGFSALETSAPKALSLTFLMNDRTTGRATSASRSAIRISRAVASMSASDNLPLPRRFLKVALRRSERVSNTVASVLEVGGGTGLPSRVSGPASRSPPPIAASGQGRTPRQRGATEDRDELVVHDRTVPLRRGARPIDARSVHGVTPPTFPPVSPPPPPPPRRGGVCRPGR